MGKLTGVGQSSCGALAGSARSRRVPGLMAAALIALSGVVLATGAGATATKPATASPVGSSSMRAVLSRPAAGTATVWLCRPGFDNDPCTSSLAKTVVEASGPTAVVKASPDSVSRFDCFYVYPTVSKELAINADLTVQKSEIAVAMAQASRFSQVCRVFAPMYRQVTLTALAAFPRLNIPASDEQTAYNSLVSGFSDYMAHYNDGRPIIFIGHSQGAAILIKLLSQFVDHKAAARNRLVLAIILGGDVEVHTGSLTGGSFSHIPACSRSREPGCVIAYSSFPGKPPSSALFGRPGQGVALQSGQTAKKGLQVVCVNPAALGGGAALLNSYFPSEGTVSTPWVQFPGLYSAHCETAGGATWLQVRKATGPGDKRPVVTDEAPDWGYHTADVNLALGNLVTDVSSAETSWTKTHH